MYPLGEKKSFSDVYDRVNRNPKVAQFNNYDAAADFNNVEKRSVVLRGDTCYSRWILSSHDMERTTKSIAVLFLRTRTLHEYTIHPDEQTERKSEFTHSNMNGRFWRINRNKMDCIEVK